MRIRTSQAFARRRRSRADGVNWLSFSDLMSSLLLIFILIMFYIMYQYFDMYEINMAEIARQQFDLDQANADLDEKTEKLSEAEKKMIAQQIRLDAAEKNLNDAQSILETQQAELSTAQTLLSEKETEIAEQQAALDALSLQLDAQQTQINEQQKTLNAQQLTMNSQKTKLDAQQTKLDAQQVKLDAQQQTLEDQQQTLEDQQLQIEQLVGLKTRIITSLSDALRAANISAQVDPANGAIALESDVLFAYNKYDLTEQGKRFIDGFLPVYLNVLFSEEYKDYVAEIIIEGHTDTVGDYITNLKLSQQRALAVASYVLEDNYRGITAAQKRLLRDLATANGRSWSDPVLNESGQVDMDASRRVVFKFRMTDEQMIQQLKSILEANDQAE